MASVSGGADSMAMFACLCALVPKENLFCLHVEHGLRPPEESRGDAQLVIDFCKEQNVPCHVESIPPGKIASYAKRKGCGIEAAARFFRRKALFRRAAQLGKNTRILIAHTKDDLLETALMRLLRGAGSAGLAAMPVSRGRILRPLLEVSRAEVINYLTVNKIPWREDSTNADTVFLRNKIRNKLVPLLDELFPTWKKGVSATAETQRLINNFLKQETKRINWTQQENTLTTDTANFFSLPQIIREESLFSGINMFSNFISQRRKGRQARKEEEERGEEGRVVLDSFLKPSSSPLRPLRAWRLCVNSSPNSIKRSVIRRFCEGKIKSADLGFFRISHKDGKIVLAPVKKAASETGFSLLIKEPGFYNLNGVSIEVLPESLKKGENGFFSTLPLAFRRCKKDGFPVKDEITESGKGTVFWVIIRGTDVK